MEVRFFLFLPWAIGHKIINAVNIMEMGKARSLQFGYYIVTNYKRAN